MSEETLSTTEAELYDRQIRLWGLKSQEKLRAANVLIIGVRGLGSEIVKNILLCGINKLTILDNGVVTDEELAKNFLLEPNSLGKKMAESVLLKAGELNPLVKLVADVDSVDSKGKQFFTQFTLVVATGLKIDQMINISNWCRKEKVKFICGDVFGLFGFSILDLQSHEYFEERTVLPKNKKRLRDGELVNQKEQHNMIEKVKTTMQYPKISSVLSLSTDIKPKRRSVLYYLMLILLEFRTKHNRNPQYSKKDEDIENLDKLRLEMCQLNKIDTSKFNKSLLELIFGEMVPVCSAVGGVIAQEIIKAVSHREVPINNVFLFDPVTYSGKEETV